MKKNLKILLPIIIVVIIGIFIILLINNKSNQDISNQQEQVASEEENIKEEIINETGITGDAQIYDIVEDNNTQVLTVKEDLKYKVALVGMLKQAKPEYEELDKIIENQNFKNGVYINEKSRQQFLEILDKYTENNYIIDENGYLQIQKQNNENDADIKMREKINSENLIIFDFSDMCYTIDEVSGEITDYPFEAMDPYQVSQIYQQGNQKIVFITTNTKGKLTEDEIIKEIIEN